MDNSNTIKKDCKTFNNLQRICHRNGYHCKGFPERKVVRP